MASSYPYTRRKPEQGSYQVVLGIVPAVITRRELRPILRLERTFQMVRNRHTVALFGTLTQQDYLLRLGGQAR